MRTKLASCMMAVAAGGWLSLTAAALPASAQERTLVFMNSGGVLLEAQQEAFIKSFEVETGIRVVTVSPVDFAKIQTQVEVGRVQVDVVEWSAEFAVRYCGDVLQEITDEVDIEDFRQEYVVSKCGVPQATFTHPFFYNKSAFPDEVPRTWADFFDTEKFPGVRAIWNSGFGSNFEKALIADGVAPDELYPLDLDRALAKWDNIRDNLYFWGTAAQLVQVMQEGSVELVSGWGPAATQAIINGADAYEPVMVEPILLFNQHMVPNGAPNREEALEFIKYVTSREAQTRLVTSYPEGPTRKGVEPETFDNEVLEKNYPGSAKNAVRADPVWRSEHLQEMGDKWVGWATQ